VNRFSKRTGWPTAQNRIAVKVAAKRRDGIPFIDLTQSNPTRCEFNYLNLDLLRPFANSKNLSYDPDPRGLLEAREAVCGYYAKKGTAIQPDQIFLTASTSEAYSFLFRLLADPGDTVLVPKPGYPLFDHLCDLHDIRSVKYPLIYDTRDGWKIALNDLEKCFDEKPKAFIAIHPNNPTGNFLLKEEAKTASGLCARHSCAFVSDEVFLDFPAQDSARPVSLAGNQDCLTFTLSGISKILGLPQMKLSWMVVSGPADQKNEALDRLEVISDTFLSVNTPSQRALCGWLPRQDAVQAEILSRIRENHKYLSDRIRKNKQIEIFLSAGGWYNILKIRTHHGEASDEAIALTLLEKQNVLVSPGYFFDLEEEDCLILSLIVPVMIFKEGVDRLLSGL
jgi:hypothetical protein